MARTRTSAARRARPARADERDAPRTLEAKVVAIGNSRGVRLPMAILARYSIGEAVLLEVREDGVLLRRKEDDRLSWEDTYREMARKREDFRDLDATSFDGLEIYGE
jgi:antitoxin MazE